MEKNKEIYDIIFLNDSEININSGKENERPCLIVGIDISTGGAYVVPLTSQYRPDDPNRMQHQLASGSFIDLSDTPIYINEAKVLYSRLSMNSVDMDDIEELDFRFQKYIKD